MNAGTIRLSQQLQAIAKRLDQDITQATGARVAFTLLVFTEGRASYISTADRAESVRELRHLLDHLESGTPDIPAHEYQS